MKNLITISAAILILSACGGAETPNPYSVVESVAVVDQVQPIQEAQPDPVVSPEPIQMTPEPQPEPVVIQEPVSAPIIETEVEMVETIAPETEAAVVRSEVAPPRIFRPGTNELIKLERPRLDRSAISDQLMVCDVVYWDAHLRQLIKGSNATTTWQHFEGGSGEMMAFRGAPVVFDWSVNESSGAYESETSPFAQEFAERVEYPNSRIAYRFWDIENTAREFFECYWN